MDEEESAAEVQPAANGPDGIETLPNLGVDVGMAEPQAEAPATKPTALSEDDGVSDGFMARDDEVEAATQFISEPAVDRARETSVEDAVDEATQFVANFAQEDATCISEPAAGHAEEASGEEEAATQFIRVTEDPGADVDEATIAVDEATQFVADAEQEDATYL